MIGVDGQDCDTISTREPRSLLFLVVLPLSTISNFPLTTCNRLQSTGTYLRPLSSLC